MRSGSTESMKAYLAGCAMDGSVSAGIDTEDYQSLQDHDKIYHRGGYKEGDRCKVREMLKKSDNPDRVMAKAEKYEGRTNLREETRGLLEKVLGGKVKFTESEGDSDDGGSGDSVWFEMDTPKSYRGMFGAELGYKANELRNAGYELDAESRYSGGREYYAGRIRKFTPKENLERVKGEKPDEGGYDFVVEGKFHEDYDSAMAAWKRAMSKYGKMVKTGK